MKASTPLRPVAARTSLKAASTASVPAGPQNCTRAWSARPGGRVRNSSVMKASLTGVARSRTWRGAPESRTLRIASRTTGWLCPRARVAGAGKTVEVAAAVGALDGQTACTYRHDREGTGIGACRRLAGGLASQDSLVRGAVRRWFLDGGVPRHGLPGCGLGHGHGSPVVALCRGKRFPRGLTRPDIRNPGTLCSTARHIDAPTVGKSPGIGAPETEPSMRQQAPTATNP